MAIMGIDDVFKAVIERVRGIGRALQFGQKKQQAFLEDLYTLIHDGVPANRAIEMMAKSTTGIVKVVSTHLTNTIAQGQPLAEGMKLWFKPNIVEIIRVGEASGALEQTLQSAVNVLAQQGAALGGLITAVAYPIFVIIIACGVILYLQSSVFEQFKALKPVEQWPDAGKQLLALAGFIRKWWAEVVIGIVAIIVSFSWLFANYTGAFRSFLDRYPPFSLYRQLIAARLLETLGLLVANGVVFKSAIRVMQLQANPYMHSHLLRIEYLLSKGRTNIAEVLDTGLINESDLMRLRVMAEVKGFEHGLIRMGIRGAENVAKTMGMIAKILGGVLLVTGGLMVIVIVRGIFMTGMAMGS